MYREKKLFIIGIDDYDTVKFTPLDNPVNDAKRVIKVLTERYGYALAHNPLYDAEASYDNIVDGLHTLADSSYGEDVLLIFYAGHGDQDGTSKRGFWIPIDGQDEKKRSKRILNSIVIESIERMKFKHVLLISDSCYSGTFISTKHEIYPSLRMDEADELASRWVFVSGGLEPVKDGLSGKGSPFVNSICRYLETNKKSRFPTTDLFVEVIGAVNKSRPQTPNAAPLNIPAHKGGILIFETNNPELIIEQTALIEAIPLPFMPPYRFYIPRTVSPYADKNNIFSFLGSKSQNGHLISLLDTEKRVVLLGNAGSGKSVELHQLRADLIKNPGRFIPVYARMNTFQPQELEDFLPKGWQAFDPYMLVIILDGFDEIHPTFFMKAIQSIEAFVERNPLVRMVISCRTNFYELPDKAFAGTLETFTAYTLNDVSLTEIKCYVTDSLSMDGDRFIREVIDHNFVDLVQKPFFLDILLKYFDKYENLSANRSDIIKDALKERYVVNRKQHAEGFPTDLTEEIAFSLLEKLSFVMEMMGKNYLTDAELDQLFPHPGEHALVSYLPTFYHDKENGRWQFEHNNIQEYLAAKVLSRQTLENVLQLITIPGTQKIKPSWANTLSFFVSIREESSPLVEEVLKWLLENDKQFILRFEAERVPDDLRMQVVMEILQFHADQNIWISSNKFTEKDIARIGAFPAVVEYLLASLDQPTSTSTVVFNAFRVLRYYDYDKQFPGFKEPFKRSLLRLLRKADTTDYMRYSILHAIGELRLMDNTEIETIIQTYRKSKNAYIRAGLYKLIISGGLVDRYVDVFLEGLDPENIPGATGDRSSTSLLDEQTRLVDGLTRLRTALGILQLLDNFKRPSFGRQFSNEDRNSIIDSLQEKAVLLFPQNPELYDAFLEALIEVESSFDHEVGKRLSVFFRATQTEYTAFQAILRDDTLGPAVKTRLIALTVNPVIIEDIVSGYIDGIYTPAEIKEIHQAIFWERGGLADAETMLSELERSINQLGGIRLERPQPGNWTEIQHARTQESFDLLFIKEKMKEIIRSIFAQIGKEKISWSDVSALRSVHEIDSAEIPRSAISLLSEYFRGGNLCSLQVALALMDLESYDFYIVHEIYQYLQAGYSVPLVVSDSQKEFVIHWCQRTVATADIEKYIENSNAIIMVLWHFIQEYKVSIPDEQLMPFTLYYDFRNKTNLQDPGSIEWLEEKIPVEKVREKVVQNLKTYRESPLIWLNNASYAIQVQLDEAYPLIIEQLITVDGIEYKYEELILLWADTSNTLEPVKTVAKSALSYSLRLAALKILSKKEDEISSARSMLSELLTDEKAAADIKISAANLLMSLNDVRGLAFLTDITLTNPNLRDIEHTFGLSIVGIKTTDALPYLLQLLDLSLQPSFRDVELPNFFLGKILDAFFAVGTQSREAFENVKSAIMEFVEKNTGKFPDLAFLKVNVFRMEEQMTANQDKSLTLAEALHRYNQFI